MIDLAPIRALLDIHMGRGASKAALHAHILAYEHLVPALLSGLAAAQAAPVVEWYATTVGEAARAGMFWMSIGPGGWTLRVRLPFGLGIGDLVESGEETGTAGKAACEAAYRRACGLPAIPACAG